MSTSFRYSKMNRKKTSEIKKCPGCDKPFAEMFQLRYHIRRQHFNLKAKLPYCNQKKVNQVWFERVHNSNNVMEIRKTGPNTLVMRKLDENTAIKVAEQNTEEIDLTHIYPTGEMVGKVECKICQKEYERKSIKKHMEEVHYNKRKHHCNNCDSTFKRLYQFLKHVCTKQRPPRGVKQVSDDIIIASFQSLATFHA
ncbi:zinc finger protein 568-like [Ostrinia furnacalis]|uniref:zinc finger protein 568-like n=1 Tax=Ostrinia furnacalis TaxID=93504 RepID=UPI0010405A68|nr:zinc finger protein 568-like [Ostrinia furnacalis]